jgi:hypothetical protein
MMSRATVARPVCAIHNTPLDGGPVLYWCPSTGHNVHAADLDTEFVAVTP